MSEYTVVLLRPEAIADTDAPDAYIAIGVKCKSGPGDAVRLAQREVFKADTDDALLDELGVVPADYKMIAVFEGRHEPVLYGFQAY